MDNILRKIPNFYQFLYVFVCNSLQVNQLIEKLEINCIRFYFPASLFSNKILIFKKNDPEEKSILYFIVVLDENNNEIFSFFLESDKEQDFSFLKRTT